VLWDDNRISIDGAISLSSSEDMLARFTACGWAVKAIDGHDASAIEAALSWAQTQTQPTLIACRTTIAFGAPTKAGSEKSHGSPLGAAEIAGAREKLGWPHAPFVIPDDILTAWRSAGARGQSAREMWQARAKSSAFERDISGLLPEGWQAALQTHKNNLLAKSPTEATRKSSEHTLAALVPAIPALIGGSADLTGSNNTKVSPMKGITAEDFSGRYVYWGIREHGMAAAMNGLALHGGVIPYAGTFLVFTDYCRPAIRLSALMGLRVIYVMTHDSIGLGEDGPTHQPVEHLAALRAIPNLLVFRPCDAIETAECWEIALEQPNRPSVLALSRQNLPPMRCEAEVNRSAKGGYILSKAQSPAEVSLIATGSEVHLALKAQSKLAEKGIAADVVSMPCVALFDAQDADYRHSVLPPSTRKIGIEAAIRMGWDHLIGSDGKFVGMTGFGASAPAERLYQEFGITVEHIVEAAL
jgi:transketolase